MSNRWAVPVLLVALVGHAVVLAIWPQAHLLLIDLQVYRAGGERVLHGLPLYDGGVVATLPFVYPPFAALLFAPLSVLPLPVLDVVWTAASLLLLALVVRRCGVRDPLVVAAVTIGATWLDPVRTTLYLGQINLLLLALVALDLLPGRSRRFQGVGVGLAAALKLTPLVFVAYLLVTGRWRAATTALGTFAVAIGLGWLVAPADSARYWLQGTFAAADRISPAAATTNHAFAGWLARLVGTSPAEQLGAWAGAAVLVVATLALARAAHRAGQETLAVALCGLCAAAAAPFAWSHHWVWVVPLAVVLAGLRDVWARWLLGATLFATVAVITRLPGPDVGPIPATGLISLWPETYLALFALVLAVVATRLRRLSDSVENEAVVLDRAR